MDQEDVNRVLDNLHDQNPEEVMKWYMDHKMTERTLIKAEKAIIALERAKVLP